MAQLTRDLKIAESCLRNLASRGRGQARFLLEATIEDANADWAVTIKLDSDSQLLSCASQPTVLAMMLDQLDARPRHRVL